MCVSKTKNLEPMAKTSKQNGFKWEKILPIINPSNNFLVIHNFFFDLAQVQTLKKSKQNETENGTKISMFN